MDSRIICTKVTFKTKRKEKGFTLRQFCLKYGYDPGNLSRLERGIYPPPQNRNKLKEYATCLGIKKGSPDWYTFFDLAAVESGKIPVEIMENEEVLDKLPLLFRTLRGEKVPDEKLNELIGMIKGNNS